MTYSEKNSAVALVCYLFIAGYFVLGLVQMQSAGGLQAASVFTLWAVVIVATILANILASILTNILLAILHAIRTGGREEERFVSDERDALINLKGWRVAHIAFSLGVCFAMIGFVLGRSALEMFSIIAFSSILGEMFGELARLFLYRKAG
jgi:hypothetical protein